MAQPFVTGPGHIFCGVGPGKAPIYLGTAENTPRIEIRPSHTPYFNSLFSAKVPMDWNEQGEEAFVVADVNRWNEAVYEACAARPNPAGIPGLKVAGDLGTMVIFEGVNYPLWIQFPYFAKAAMAAGGMPAGYRFYNTRLVGPDTIEPISMEPSKRRLIWHCLPSLTVGPNNTTIAGLYDGVMGVLPAVT